MVDSVGNQSSGVGDQGPAAEKNTSLDFTTVKQADGSTAYQTSSGKVMDISGLVSYIGVKVASGLDTQLANKRQEMAAKNTELSKANDILSELRNGRPKDTDDDASLSGNVKAWFSQNMPEISVPSGSINQGQWDQVIENVKSSIDGMNATSQTDSIDVDALVKRHDESYDFLSNYNKLLSQTMQTIINNMRTE